MVESTTAASFRPYDVTQFKSRDAAAAVLLANSLGWRVIPRGNGPTALIAEDGKQIRVPDNSGIKMDVFRGWVHQIAVHTDGVSITRGLIDQIVKATKLNREHAHLMYELAEDQTEFVIRDDVIEVRTASPRVPEPEPAEPAEHLPRGAEPYILTREPYVNTKGVVRNVAYERKWSDGHVDYECPLCGVAWPQIKSINSHRQWHIGRGEVPGQEIKHKVEPKRRKRYDPTAVTRAKPPEPVEQGMVQMSEEVATDAIQALRLIEQIRSLVGSEAEVKQLKLDLNHAHERIARLEGDRQALREMLSE